MSDPRRNAAFDPVLRRITHYRRVGREGALEFRCGLSGSRRRTDPAVEFVLPLTALLFNPAYLRALTQDYGFCVQQRRSQYQEGEDEDAWVTGSSDSEGVCRPRRRVEGSWRRLVKAPAAPETPRASSRSGPAR